MSHSAFDKYVRAENEACKRALYRDRAAEESELLRKLNRSDPGMGGPARGGSIQYRPARLAPSNPIPPRNPFG